MKINLAKVSFGKSSAEKERDTLPDYFVPTQAYKNARNTGRKKLFYIGYRGSGKSALFNQLAHEYSDNNNNIVLQITPTDYSYDAFKRLKHDIYDIKAAYSVAWNYTLLIQIFIEILDHFQRQGVPRKHEKNLEEIKNYLKDNEYIDYEGRLEIFLHFLKRIAVSKINFKIDSKLTVSGEIGERTREISSLFNMGEIRKAQKALENILRSYSVHIFIDELDTGWNNTKEAVNFISGLISATIKLNGMSGLNIYVSLRQDMYKNLSEIFRDTEKLRDDIEVLKWDYKSLENLICQRIKSCKEVKEKRKHYKFMRNEQVVECVFEPGAFEYLVQHTLNRPREVIHFCSLSLDSFIESAVEEDYIRYRLDLDIIKGVEKRFSTERLEDFCKEYEDELPGIKELLSAFEGGKKIFNKADFILAVEEILFEMHESHPEIDWITDFLDKPEKFFEKLFHIGFVKISINGDGVFYAYYDHIPLSFRNVKKVQINNMFLPALQCL
ncbi:MAG: hypothetical protein AAFY45_20980 [Bacteroidota bacterium]